MKNFMLKIKKYIYFMCSLLIVIFSSCNTEPIENYKGDIIYYKDRLSYRIKLKFQDIDSTYKFRNVFVMEYDWNKYEVGDTIK